MWLFFALPALTLAHVPHRAAYVGRRRPGAVPRARLHAEQPPHDDGLEKVAEAWQPTDEPSWTRARAAARAGGSASGGGSSGSGRSRSSSDEDARTGDVGRSPRLATARRQLQRALDEADGLVEPVSGEAVPSVPYDPAAASARFATQPLAVGLRQMKLLGPLLLFVGKVLIDVHQGKEEARRQERAEELLGLISSLGPAIIKAGQALSSRSDLLPAEYLKELIKLQDRVPPFANAEAFAILEAELGRPSEEAFRAISPEPVAAASLGQVYRAELRRDGTPVAIKILRPGVEATIALDLHILRSYSMILTKLTRLLGRDLDLVSVIDDFGRLIYAEIDYGVEASNARRFQALYGGIPNVSSPTIHPDLSTRRVLTMEWIDGVRITDLDALRARGHKPAALVDTLVQCSMRQMLAAGFFHADPHAGNLLVTDDGMLVYIDFGMMSFLAPAQRYAIIEAVVHMVNRDFHALASLYKELGFIPEGEDIAPITAALHDALPDVLSAPVSELNFKNVVERLGDVMYQYPFSLPPYYIAIIRCLGVLEGVALQVDDGFAIIQDAYPYIAARLLTDTSPQLQRALSQLIFRDGRLRWDLLEGLLANAAETSEYDLLTAGEQLAAHQPTHYSPLAHHLLTSLLTTHYSLLTTHYSLLTTHHWLTTCSPLATGSLCTTDYLPLALLPTSYR